MKLADPVASSGTETDAVPLSENVTDPVGIPEVDAVTVDVKVTDLPGAAGFGDELIETLVFACVTVCVIAAEVLGSKFASP